MYEKISGVEKANIVLSFVCFRNEITSRKIKNGIKIKIISLRVKNAIPKIIPAKAK